MMEHGSNMEIQREVNNSQTPSGQPVQVHGQGLPVESKSREFSHTSMPKQSQVPGTSNTQVREPCRMLKSSNESQFSNMQRVSNQPVLATEQVGSSANLIGKISLGRLLPIILPDLDKDTATQLNDVYGKLRRNEIAQDQFVRLMKSCVGDQMLRLAVVKMQAKVQSQSPGQKPHVRPPTGTAAQVSDPYSFGLLHQRNHGTPSVTRTSASVSQPVKDLGHQTVGSHSLKSIAMGHLTDTHGVQANQKSDRSDVSKQGLSKQQQHLQFAQSSTHMNGASSYHPFTGENVSTPSTLAKHQLHDPQAKQGQLHQVFGSAHGDDTSLAIDAMNAPKVERENSFYDTKRISDVTMVNVSTPSMQHTPVPWQVSKDSQNMSFVKQDPSEKSLEKQPKPQISSSQGLTFSGAVLIDQGESLPVSSNDELLDRHISHHSRIDYPSSVRTASEETSGSVSSHEDTDFQVESQSISARPINGIGSNSKASSIKPYSGQKKPLDELASLSPLPSKKQKVSGDFFDQSIEHLNDITAVSGVNLREEEAQLFSGPKDDSRVSEASLKSVQEEEDRLFLQKNPLQKKLAEIMTKCGLKNLSNDVERCLSLCVEERLRALISNLIGVSKQRADSEKSRHATVVTSDVREQILALNRKSRKEWDKKQAEAEKLRKQNEPDSSTVVDADKEKDEGRAKSLKMLMKKEEDGKLHTASANVAARAAFGGDDMLLKWKLMAQTRQKREGGPQIATGSQVGKDATNKQLTTSLGLVQEIRGTEKRDSSAGHSASGVVRQGGRSQIDVPPPRVAPRISVRDVIVVLEREPQMAKSSIIYRLNNRMHADPAAE